MSLLIWLPLNQDLRNNGLADITVTNTNSVLDTNGILGKCYLFDTSNSYLTLSNNAINSCTDECSVSFWINIISWNTSYATIFQAGAASYNWVDYTFGILRNNATSNLCFTISQGSTSSKASYTTPNLALDTWYHLTFIYKTGHCLIYVNGALYQDYTTTIVPQFSSIAKTTIGTCNDISHYQSNVKLNDFRIYNHALSPKEVELLARGLVAHYPLNNNGTGQPNLYDFETKASKWTTDGVTKTDYSGDSIYDNVLKISTSDTLSNFYRIYHSFPGWIQNQIYTISFMAKASKTVIVKASRSVADYASDFTVDTTWKRYSGTITSTATATTGTLSIQLATTNADLYITQIKLELGDKLTAYQPGSGDPAYTQLDFDSVIEDDISGYEYNGTKLDINYTTDTAKYDVSSQFNGTTSKISVPIIYYNSRLSQMSFTFWIKRNLYSDSTARIIYNGISKIFLHTDYKLRISWIHATASTYPTNTWASGLLIPTNEWHHICFTFDGGVMTLYYDGTQYRVSDRSDTGQFIGAYNVGNSCNIGNAQYGGDLSDFRIYATALTADQVKELYQTSASIANNGTVFTNMLIEN